MNTNKCLKLKEIYVTFFYETQSTIMRIALIEVSRAVSDANPNT